MTVAIQLRRLGWVEGFTMTADHVPIVAWWAEHGSLLCRVMPDRTLEPLWPDGPRKQTASRARGARIAFLGESSELPGMWRLFCGHIGQRRWNPTALPPRQKPFGFAWLDDDTLLAACVDDDGAMLASVDVRPDGSVRPLCRLPGGAAWMDPAPEVSRDGQVALVVRSAGGQSIGLWQQAAPEIRVAIAGNSSAAPAAMRWSPDGRHLVVLVRRARKREALLVDVASGNSEVLAIPDVADMPVWTGRPSQLVLCTWKWPYSGLATFDLATRALAPIPLSAGILPAAPQWHDDTCYFVGVGPDRPPALHAWRAATAKTVQLTPSAALHRQAPPDILELEHPEGFRLPCLLYEPAQGSVAGTVVMLHGGPAGTWCVGWEPFLLALCEAGYRVAQIETRGSSFRDWPIPPVTPGCFGTVEIEDVRACLDRLIERGVARAGRIALYGHSHGAFIALRTARQHAGLVAAAVLASGYTAPGDLDHTRDPLVRRFRDHAFGPASATDDEDTCPVPCLFIHGEHDQQVPVDVIRHRAARLGDQHRLLVLPGESHIFAQRDNVAHWIESAVSFLNQKVGATS